MNFIVCLRGICLGGCLNYISRGYFQGNVQGVYPWGEILKLSSGVFFCKDAFDRLTKGHPSRVVFEINYPESIPSRVYPGCICLGGGGQIFVIVCPGSFMEKCLP